MNTPNGEMKPTQLVSLTVHANDKPVFTITADGRVVIGEAFNPAQGSDIALKALAQQVPKFLSGAIALFCRGQQPNQVTRALIRGALGGQTTVNLADQVYLAVSEQIAIAAEEAGQLMTDAIIMQRAASAAADKPADPDVPPTIQ